MLMPSIFGESLLDDFFDFPFENSYRSGRSQLMRTDIKDTDQGYEVTMNLPGVKERGCKGRTEGRISDHQRFFQQQPETRRMTMADTSAENVTAGPAAEVSM